VDGNDVLLEVAPGVEVRYVKRAIMEVLPDEEDGDADGMPEDPDLVSDADDESETDAGDESDDAAEDETGDGHVAADEKAGDSV
jgi:preprotein translocase subunit YajC